MGIVDEFQARLKGQKLPQMMEGLSLNSGSSSPSGSSSGTKPTSSDVGSLTWALGRKRLAVAADTRDAATITSYSKTETVKRLIEGAIRDNLLFHGLPAAALAAIIDSMQPRSVLPGKDIIKQGDTDASEFFVLESGTCEVYVQQSSDSVGKKVLTYGPGSAFGELALLYSAPRAATVRTTSACQLWVAARSVVHTIKRHVAQKLVQGKLELLDKVLMLQCLTDEHKQLLAGTLEQVNFADKQIVYSEALPQNDHFYIIKEGAAVVQDAASGQVLNQLVVGDHAGEKALLKNSIGYANAGPKGIQVVAQGPLSCFMMRGAEFERLLGPYESVWRFEALRKVPILFSLSQEQLWQLVKLLVPENVVKGATVFKKGDYAEKFYIVESGSFTCFTPDGREVARAGPGQCFGELALLTGDGRALSVMALESSKVLTLHREQFQLLLGSLDSLRHMWRFEALRRVPLLDSLPDKARAELAASLAQYNAPKGSAVVNQGEEGDAFYIVESGQLAAFKDGSPNPVMAYGPGDYFGELALIGGDHKRAATVRARTEVTLLVLNMADFKRLLGPLLPQLQEFAKTYTGQRKGKEQVALADLQLMSILGAGGFGKVTLVAYQGKHYALKQMLKSHIVEHHLNNHVHREKKFMLECDSPWLVNLVCTMKDAKSIYMLMEVVLGGELFAYLQTRRAPLTEAHARFYVASVVLALEYLHSRHLVYRDLKPENLLIGTDGYVKMADFGFVKKVLPGERTSTLCGTPEYLAPEVVKSEGHWQAADWWSVGVLVYELVAGCPPFYCEDRMAMYEAIVHVKYGIPRHFSQELANLVSKLLVRNPAFRLASAADIKAHPWFRGFDWQAFQARQMAAPYIPRMSHPGDASNFNAIVDPNAVCGAGSRKPYVSTGLFKDF